jgi:hypothetical protein
MFRRLWMSKKNKVRLKVQIHICSEFQFENFHNCTLVMANKLEVIHICYGHHAVLHSTKILPHQNFSIFQRFIITHNFRTPILSGTSVVPISQESHVSRLLLLAVKKEKLWTLDYLQCHNVHTKFLENQRSGSQSQKGAERTVTERLVVS